MNDDPPVRVRLSRARGARLAPGVVNVARPGPWGNPFVVGRDGTAAECVALYRKLLAGYVSLTDTASIKQQQAVRQHALHHLHELRGRSLACWCGPARPCHADVLLDLAASLDTPDP